MSLVKNKPSGYKGKGKSHIRSVHWGVGHLYSAL